jgi:hypothetical protein
MVKGQTDTAGYIPGRWTQHLQQAFWIQQGIDGYGYTVHLQEADADAKWTQLLGIGYSKLG